MLIIFQIMILSKVITDHLILKKHFENNWSSFVSSKGIEMNVAGKLTVSIRPGLWKHQISINGDCLIKYEQILRQPLFPNPY
jgi:hypothetical protein